MKIIFLALALWSFIAQANETDLENSLFEQVGVFSQDEKQADAEKKLKEARKKIVQIRKEIAEKRADLKVARNRNDGRHAGNLEKEIAELKDKRRAILNEMQIWLNKNTDYLPYSATAAMNQCHRLVKRQLKEAEKYHIRDVRGSSLSKALFDMDSGTMFEPKIFTDVKVMKEGEKSQEVKVKTSISNKEEEIRSAFPQIDLKKYKKLSLKTVQLTSQLKNDKKRISEVLFLYEGDKIVGVKRSHNELDNSKKLQEYGHLLFEFNPDCQLIHHISSQQIDTSATECKEYFKVLGTNQPLLEYIPRLRNGEDRDDYVLSNPKCKMEMSERFFTPLVPVIKLNAWENLKIKYSIERMESFFEEYKSTLLASEEEHLRYQTSDEYTKQLKDNRCQGVIKDDAQITRAGYFHIFENRCRVYAPFYNSKSLGSSQGSAADAPRDSQQQ